MRSDQLTRLHAVTGSTTWSRFLKASPTSLLRHRTYSSAVGIVLGLSEPCRPRRTSHCFDTAILGYNPFLKYVGSAVRRLQRYWPKTHRLIFPLICWALRNKTRVSLFFYIYLNGNNRGPLLFL